MVLSTQTIIALTPTPSTLCLMLYAFHLSPYSLSLSMSSAIRWAIVLFTVVFLPQCKEKKIKEDKIAADAPATNTAATSPSFDYNFAAAEKTALPFELTEISGINYIGENKMAAQQDEDGIVYIINTTTGNIEEKHKFGSADDYEDIVTTTGFYYLLASNGDIFKVDRSNPSKKTTVQFKFGQRNKEFESLYLDNTGKNLVLVCKNCGGDAIDAYGFDLEKEAYNETPLYSIDVKTARETIPALRKNVRPSAAAIQPVDKKLYIVCSIGSSVLVCDLQGKIEQVFELPASLYPQPEGIAFAPNGDMYISNEGGGGKGTLVKIPYQKR